MKKLKFTEILTKKPYDYKLSNGWYAVCNTAMSKIYKNLPEKVEVEVANYYFPHSKKILFRAEAYDNELRHYTYFNTEYNSFRNLYTTAGDCICSHLRVSASGDYNIWVKFKKL